MVRYIRTVYTDTAGIRRKYETKKQWNTPDPDGVNDDFSFAIPGLSRFRVSAYKQRGSLAAVIRVIAFRLPDYKQLRIPDQVMKLSELNKGLVLVTGPAGSGMISMDQSLINLYKEGKISKETAILYASNPEMITKRIR